MRTMRKPNDFGPHRDKLEEMNYDLAHTLWELREHAEEAEDQPWTYREGLPRIDLQRPFYIEDHYPNREP